jgi:hypothetical protein
MGHGGLTVIDAMVLPCGHHHTALHAGVYQIAMRDGLPRVRVPSWQDQARPWLRNTTHGHLQIADTLARTMLTGHSLPVGGTPGPESSPST